MHGDISPFPTSQPTWGHRSLTGAAFLENNIYLTGS